MRITSPDGTVYTWDKPTPPTQADIDAIVTLHKQKTAKKPKPFPPGKPWWKPSQPGASAANSGTYQQNLDEARTYQKAGKPVPPQVMKRLRESSNQVPSIKVGEPSYFNPKDIRKAAAGLGKSAQNVAYNVAGGLKIPISYDTAGKLGGVVEDIASVPAGPLEAAQGDPIAIGSMVAPGLAGRAIKQVGKAISGLRGADDLITAPTKTGTKPALPPKVPTKTATEGGFTTARRTPKPPPLPKTPVNPADRFPGETAIKRRVQKLEANKGRTPWEEDMLIKDKEYLSKQEAKLKPNLELVDGGIMPKVEFRKNTGKGMLTPGARKGVENSTGRVTTEETLMSDLEKSLEMARAKKGKAPPPTQAAEIPKSPPIKEGSSVSGLRQPQSDGERIHLADTAPKMGVTYRPGEAPVTQANLEAILPKGRTSVFHETNVGSARSIVQRTFQGLVRHDGIFASDDPALALGQGGKGVLLEFDAQRVNGRAYTGKPGSEFSVAAGMGGEFVIDRTIKRSVVSITAKSKRQLDALAKDFGKTFDFENPVETEYGWKVGRRAATLSKKLGGTTIFGPRLKPGQAAEAYQAGKKAVGEGFDNLEKGLQPVAGVSRTMQTIGDISATFRQGGYLLGKKGSADAIKKAMKSITDPNVVKKVEEQMDFGPNAALYKESDLFLARPGTEDPFLPSLANKANVKIRGKEIGLKPVIDASERHYNTLLNVQRMAAMDDFISKYPKASKEELKRYAASINHATGRGSLDRLHTVFYSPRFLSSRLEVPLDVTKAVYHTVTGRGNAATKEIMKDATRFVGSRALVLTIGAQTGLWKVDMDSKSPTFLKVKIGKRWYDPWAGLLQPARFMIALNNAKTDAEMSRAAGIYFGNKTAPNVNMLKEIKTGKTFDGEKATPLGTLGRAVTPLNFQAAKEAWKETNGSLWDSIGTFGADSTGIGSSDSPKPRGGSIFPKRRSSKPSFRKPSVKPPRMR